MSALPNFRQMWNKYPNGEADEVKAMIGGNVNLDWVVNTCVVRVSYCFNYCQRPIPAGFGGLLTIRGGDGKRYAVRVAEFKLFLDAKYGEADVESASSAAFGGKQGIIMFDVATWGDATGHVDLWDGTRAKHKAYFAESSTVRLWTC